MRPIIIIAAALGAAACAPVEPAGPALPLVPAAVEPGAAVGVTGEARFDVTATRGGASVPAACTAEGAGFRADFTAPATLAVPSYGAASQPVRIACTADGRQGARVVVPAFRAYGGIGGVYPAIGIGIGTGGGDGWSGSGAGVSIGGIWSPGTNGPVAAVRYPDIAIPIE
ncbi:hypothetical protein [Amaricoccus sp.]|uniref:hypothetical protein n=1 Tax=Amaricoccus sp. TaxID=1872485 RepID=UPI001B45D3B5|nr:hypothetical protein [Amaricoccus sp.]MBP7241875.1 hypothetical protein [Amaricoccus sp.]